MKLTETQKIAIEKTGFNMLLSAGAGTGKTRVLVERYLHFVTDKNVDVREILALTFTEKAANEMKKRIMKRLTEEKRFKARRDLEGAYISTLHSFASRVLKEHPVEACVHPDFQVIESEESGVLQMHALDEIIEEKCVRGGGLFEFLKVYSEAAVRKAVIKIYNEARSGGMRLAEFFEVSRYAVLPPVQDISPLLIKLGEKDLAEEWNKWTVLKNWDWQTIENFKEWKKKSFGNKRKDKETWQEIKSQADRLLGHRLEVFAEPWKKELEALCLAFEAAYDRKKKEEGMLDFDDLQLKVVELFSSDKPAGRRLRRDYQQLFKFVLVDEYQDINPLQMKLIDCLATPGNLFMVGDYKQSIYGFRGTSPAHFLAKEKMYEKGEGGVRVEMLENFRTAPEIMKFINHFFEMLWQEDNLPQQALIADESIKGVRPELLVVERREDESMDEARMREASWIASRIAEFRAEGFEYGQMGILLQTMTEIGIYEHALKTAGIPYFAVSGRGFYNQPEIRDMISLLSCLENPLSDIPLAASLRAPFFGVTDDTLFWLSQKAKEKDENAPLYNALKDFETIAQIPETEKSKLRLARECMEAWLAFKDSLRLAELLEKILEKTSYELSVLSDRQGVRRYANLRKLVQIARESEARELMSLSDFINLVRSLESHEVRESEAQVEAEESGRVVRIMTVHAAKGLEFPVCFAADLGHQKGTPESKKFLAHAGGITQRSYALQVRNELTFDWEEPARHVLLNDALSQAVTEEWKRLFYVAVTRAENRLVLSGVYKQKKTEKENFYDMACWMDWLMTVEADLLLDVRRDKESSAALPSKGLPVFAESPAFKKTIDSILNSGGDEDSPKQEDNKKDIQRAAAIFEGLAAREVPFSRVIDLPVSAYALYAKNPKEYWRVYEVGCQGGEEAIDETSADVFREEEPVSAADFGTAFHLFLERLNYQNAENEIEALAADIFHGWDEPYVKEACALARNFLKSGLFDQMKQARHVYREIPFVLNERHGKIHGVLDLLFQDKAGAWHIVDYKTAVGDEEKVKKASYDLQIAIYAVALHRIAGIVPKSGMVYFLKNQINYEMPFDTKTLEAYALRVRRIQEEILEFTAGMSI